MITLQQLKYFCTLARELHFTRASDILHITQPTLSYAIAELQKEIGVALFEKEGNKTILTKYGSAYLGFAEKVLSIVEEGEKTVKRMLGADGGIVRVGYIYSVSFDYLPNIVSRFQVDKNDPNISFQFFQGIRDQIIHKLNDGILDLGFASATNIKSMQSVPLFRQELFLVVPKDHPFSEREAVTLIEVKDEPFILDKQTSGLRGTTDLIFKEAGISPKIAYEVEECNAMAAFVGSKQGIAIMPKIPLLNTSDLSVIKISSPFLFRDINLLWKENKALNPVAEEFKNYVLDSLVSKVGFLEN